MPKSRLEIDLELQEFFDAMNSKMSEVGLCEKPINRNKNWKK